MPRETVLAAFNSPPPNAYGLLQVGTAASTSSTSYGRLRNGIAGTPIFPSRIYIKPRITPYNRVEILTTADNPVDSAGALKNWLDQQRAGLPAATIFSGLRNTFPSFTEIFGSFEVGPTGSWVEWPMKMVTGQSLWVQGYLPGGLDITFQWFEP